jgi:hypothetical protein
MRTVRIITTKGASNFTITTEAQTWNELQKDLDANNVQYQGMKAIVGETNTTLDLKDAVLPKGLTIGGKVTNDFTLFLAATKMKAGVDVDAMSYRDLKEFVKNNGGAAEFGNYTHFTTDELRDAVEEYLDTQSFDVVQNEVEEISSTEEALNTIIKIAQSALNSKTDNQNAAFHAKLMNIEFELNN